MSASDRPERLVGKLSPLIAEVMGARSGAEFYKFYELEDDDEVLAGAKALLYELMGQATADAKLKEAIRK
ncbi:MAG: hypothetical protein ACXWLH_01290 [Candidatus Saccharimonadales bacterium]